MQNPPTKPLTQSEMDQVYALPYQRTYHPSYEAQGGVPAIEEVRFSLVSKPRLLRRDAVSVRLRSIRDGLFRCAATSPFWRRRRRSSGNRTLKGYIHDVGGPTANFRAPACDKQMTKGVCPNKQCLFPTPCKNLKVDHKDYLKLLRKLRELPECEKGVHPFGYPFRLSDLR